MSTASAAGPVDLHDAGDLHEAMGQSDTTDLLKGATYTASMFPGALKIRPPDASASPATRALRSMR